MRLLMTVVLFSVALCTAAYGADEALPGQAADALSKAVRYLTEKISVGGGYLGSYKIDLATGEFVDQWGEGHATKDQNWTQPPGNPSVGMAYLRAWEATGDEQYLDAAVQVAKSLVFGQLECGGWDYIVDHSRAGEVNWFYRHNAASTDPKLAGGRNQATFDDNVSQHATRLLMAVDQALVDYAVPEAVRGLRHDPTDLEFRLISAEHSRKGDVWENARTGAAVAWEDVLAASEVVFRGSDLVPLGRLSASRALQNVQIPFRFLPERQEAFSDFTAEHVERIIAVVLDGQCLFAPVIKTRIPGVGVIDMQGAGQVIGKYGEDWEAIHDAALYALQFILNAQFDHGGWPQRFPLSTRGYSRYSTFNDNSIADCIDVMMIAWRQYGDQTYYDAILKAAQFIIDAQLPEPQATWAQQYDEEMRPGWARRFEPPAACAGESTGVMRTLIKIAEYTGDEKYIEPLPAAFDWYDRSELSKITGKDKGKWARFYELGTNKPLYFTRGTYLLTYDDSDMPTHYAFKGAWSTKSVRDAYAAIQEKGLAQYIEDRKRKPLSAEAKRRRAEGMEEQVQGIIAAQSAVGYWAKGDMIDMQTFERNIQTLATYLRMVNDR